MRVELIASMAWKRSLSEHSCLSPSHHLYQEKKMKCKWIHEDGAKRGSPIMVYGGVFGEVFIKHVLASTIKKGVPTWESQDIHHLAQMECARQRYYLDRVLFYRSHGVSGRPGCRGDAVLSRGAHEWVTWSHLCGELKPLHTWHIIFLGSYLAFIHVRI